MCLYIKPGAVRAYARRSDKRGKPVRCSREFLAALDRLVERKIDGAIRNLNGAVTLKAGELEAGLPARGGQVTWTGRKTD